MVPGIIIAALGVVFFLCMVPHPTHLGFEDEVLLDVILIPTLVFRKKMNRTKLRRRRWRRRRQSVS